MKQNYVTVTLCIVIVDGVDETAQLEVHYHSKNF